MPTAQEVATVGETIGVCRIAGAKMEALRTQVDGLRWEKNELEAENARLRDSNPEGAKLCDSLKQCEARVRDLEAELDANRAQLLKLQETLELESRQRGHAEERATELQAEKDAASAKLHELSITVEAKQEQWEQGKKFLETSAELRRYQAVEVEREKGEARESRLVAELAEIKAELTELRALKAESSTTLADHERKYSDLKTTLGRELAAVKSQLEASPSEVLRLQTELASTMKRRPATTVVSSITSSAPAATTTAASAASAGDAVVTSSDSASLSTATTSIASSLSTPPTSTLSGVASTSVTLSTTTPITAVSVSDATSTSCSTTAETTVVPTTGGETTH